MPGAIALVCALAGWTAPAAAEPGDTALKAVSGSTPCATGLRSEYAMLSRSLALRKEGARFLEQVDFGSHTPRAVLFEEKTQRFFVIDADPTTPNKFRLWIGRPGESALKRSEFLTGEVLPDGTIIGTLKDKTYIKIPPAGAADAKSMISGEKGTVELEHVELAATSGAAPVARASQPQGPTTYSIVRPRSERLSGSASARPSSVSAANRPTSVPASARPVSIGGRIIKGELDLGENQVRYFGFDKTRGEFFIVDVPEPNSLKFRVFRGKPGEYRELQVQTVDIAPGAKVVEAQFAGEFKLSIPTRGSSERARLTFHDGSVGYLDDVDRTDSNFRAAGVNPPKDWMSEDFATGRTIRASGPPQTSQPKLRGTVALARTSHVNSIAENRSLLDEVQRAADAPASRRLEATRLVDDLERNLIAAAKAKKPRYVAVTRYPNDESRWLGRNAYIENRLIPFEAPPLPKSSPVPIERSYFSEYDPKSRIQNMWVGSPTEIEREVVTLADGSKQEVVRPKLIELKQPALKGGHADDVYFTGEADSLPNPVPKDYSYVPLEGRFKPVKPFPVDAIQYSHGSPEERLAEVITPGTHATQVGEGGFSSVFVTHPEPSAELLNNSDEFTRTRFALDSPGEAYKIRTNPVPPPGSQADLAQVQGQVKMSHDALRRDYGMQGVVEQCTERARYKGSPFVEIEGFDTTYVGRGIVKQRTVSGRSAANIQKVLNLFRRADCTFKCKAGIRNLLKSLNLPPPEELPELLGALEQFYRDAHQEVLHWQRANFNMTFANASRSGTPLEIAIDYNHGQNAFWDPKARRFKLIDW